MKFYKNWYFPENEKHFLIYLQHFDSAEYQLEVRQKSFKYLDNTRTAIDIGANVGLWSRDLCKTFNQVKLFEPYPLNVDCLRKNLEDFDNFSIFEIALSNEKGLGELFIEDENGLGSCTLVSSKPKATKVDVQKRLLDGFDFENIDYIKMDVQFHELEVIQGGINTLKKHSPVLCVEACRRTPEEKSYVKKIHSLLKSLDYKIVGKFGKELFYKKL